MRILLSIVVLIAVAGSALADGASISVGDEVVFTGGPGAPPKSIQTGFTMEVGSIRGGGGGGNVPAVRGGNKGEKGHASTSAGGAGLANAAGAAGVAGAPGGEASPVVEVAAEKPQPPPDLSQMSTDDLAAALGDRDVARRQAAASALAGRSTPADRTSACAALESALADAEPAVVQAATAGLARLNATESAPAVLRMVYDRDDGTAIAAIRALATLGYKPATAELTKLAEHDLGAVGQAARAAASQLAKPRAADPRASPLAVVPVANVPPVAAQAAVPATAVQPVAAAPATVR